MMTDDQIIAVVQAHKEGKRIQGIDRSLSNIWIDLAEPIVWNFLTRDYRVASDEPRKPKEFSIFVWRDGSVHSFAGHNEGAQYFRVREVIHEV